MPTNQRIKSYLVRFVLFSGFLFSCFWSVAQGVDGINYQAIARDSSGNVLNSRDITIEFNIIPGSAGGSAIYTETHIVTTNKFGLFTTIIGRGMNTLGTFENIDWGANRHFLNVKIAVEFGTLEDLTTTELIAVPFALYAKSSGNKIVGGKGIQVFNNDSIVNVGDTSNTNELVTLFEINSSNELVLQQGANTALVIDLSQVMAASDSLEIDSSRNGVQYLSIIGGNQVQFSVFDGDSSTTNELQSLNIIPTANGDSIALSNGGGFLVADLASINTDRQNLRLAGDTLFITNGDSVNLNVFRDTAGINLNSRRIDSLLQIATNDSSNTNELQNLTLIGDSISISNGIGINLSNILGVSDVQQVNDSTLRVVNSNGTFSILTIRGIGKDSSSTNERIDSLELNGTVLRIYENSILSDTIDLGVILPPSTNDTNLVSIDLFGDSIRLVQSFGDTSFVNIKYINDSLNQFNNRILLNRIRTIANLANINLNRDSINIVQDSIANYNSRIGTNETNITNNQAAIIANASGIVDSTNSLLARINADSLLRYVNDTTLDGQLRDTSATLRALIVASGSDDQAIRFSVTGDSIVLEDGGFVDITYINDSIANYNNRITATEDSIANYNSRIGTNETNITSNSTNITNNQAAIIANASGIVDSTNSLLARINADSLLRYVNDTTLDGQLRDTSATLRALIVASGSDDQAIRFSVTGDSIVLEDGGFVDITYINDSIANYNNRITATEDSISSYANRIGTNETNITSNSTNITNNQSAIIANASGIVDSTNSLLARINADSLMRYVNDTTLDGQLRDTSATLRALIVASGSDDQAIRFSVTGDSIVLEDGGFVDITYINDSIANYNNRITATEDSISSYANRIGTNETNITSNSTNITNNQSAIIANASGIVDSTNSLLARINADSLMRYVNDTTLDGQLRDTSATLRALIIASGSDDQAIRFSVTGDSIVLEDGGFVDITYINDSIANYNNRLAATEDSIANYNSRIGTNETNITSNSTNITNNQAAIIANASGIVDSTNSLLARINADSLLRYVNDTTLDGQLRDTSATLRALIIASGTDDQAIGFSITGDSIVLEDGGFVDITYINDSIANYNSRIGTNETNITSNATNITNNQAAIIANASGIVDSTNSLLARINADSLLRYVNDTTLDGQLRDTSATLRALIIASGTDDQAIGFSITGDSIVLEDGGFVDITYINDSIANYNSRIGTNETNITSNATNITNNQAAIIANASGIVDSTNSLLARINADSLLRYVNDTTLDGQLRDTSATLRALIIASGTDDQAIGFSITGDSIVLEDGGFVDITYINDSIANYNNRITANEINNTNNQSAITANASGIVDSTNSLLARINADSLLRYVNDTTLDGQLRDTSATLRALIIASGTDDQAIGFSITGDSIVLEDGGFVDITYINDSIANYNSRIGTNETNITSNTTNITNNQAAIIANASGIVDSTNSLLARINADSLLRYVNDTTLDGQLRDTSATLRALIIASGTDDQAIGFSITGDSIMLEDGGFVDITYINDSIANYNSRIGTNETNITSNATNITNNQAAIIANASGIVDSTNSLLARINADSLLRYVNDTTLDGQLRDTSATLRALIIASGTDDQAIGFSVTGDSIVLEDGGFVDITYINDSIANYNNRLAATEDSITNYNNRITANEINNTNNQSAITANASGIVDSTNSLLARINADSLLRYVNDTTLDGQLRDTSATLRALIIASGTDDQAIGFSITGDSIMLEDGGFVDITYINDSIANYNNRITANEINNTNNQSAITANASGIVDSTNSLLARINADSLLRYVNDTTLDGQLRDTSATLRALITASGTDDQAIGFSVTGDSIVLEDGGFVDITYINDSIANYSNRLAATEDSITNYNSRIGTNETNITSNSTNITNNQAAIIANASGIVDSTNSLLARINADSLLRYVNDTTLDGQLRDTSATLRALITASGTDDQAIGFSITGDSIVLEDGGFVDITYINDSIANYNSRIGTNETNITSNSTNITNNQAAIIANASGIVDSTNSLLARINADSLLRYVNDTTLDGQLRDTSATLRALIIASGTDDQAIGFSITGDSIVLEDGGFVDITYINDSIANYNSRIGTNETNITSNSTNITNNQAAIIANASGIVDSTNNLLARINADSLLRYVNDTTLDGQLRDTSATLRTLITASGTDDQAIGFSITGDSIVLEDGGFVDITYINDSIANYNSRIGTNETNITSNATNITNNQAAIIANASGIVDSTNSLLARINADSLLRYVNDTTLDGQLRDTSATLRALIIASGTDDQAIGFSVTGDSIVLEDGGFVDITYINDSIANYNNRITANEINNTNNQSAITANASGIVDSTNSLLARINTDSLLRYVNDTTLDGQLRDTSATLRALIIASGTDDQAIGFSVTGDSIVLEDGGFVDITYINDSIANYNNRLAATEDSITNYNNRITANEINNTNNQSAITANASGIVDSTNSLLARINADSLLRYVSDTTLDGQLRDTSATLRALIIASGTDDQAIGFSITGDSIVLEDGGFVDITYINDSIANYNSRIGTNETNITSNATNITNNQAAIIANASGIVDSTNSLLARINADSLLRYVNDTTLDGQLRDTSATLRALIVASGSDDQAIRFSVTGDSIVLEDGGFVDITYINDSIANYNNRITATEDSIANYNSRIGTNETNITSNSTNITNNQAAIIANASGIVDSTNSLLARINADSLLRYVNDTTLDGQLRDTSATLRTLITASGTDDQAIGFSITGDSIVLEDGGFVDITYINDSIANYNSRIGTNETNITSNSTNITNNQSAIIANASGIVDSTNSLLARINADSLLRYVNDTTLDGQLRDTSATLRALIVASGSDDQAIRFSVTGDSIVLEDGGFVDITYINDSIANYNNRITATEDSISSYANRIGTNETNITSNSTNITNNQAAIIANASGIVDSTNSLLARINADSLLRYVNDTTLDGQLRDTSATLRALIIASGTDDQAIGFSVTGDSIVLEDGGFVDITYINDSIANYNNRITANEINNTNNQSAITANASGIVDSTNSLLARINTDSLLRYVNDTTLDGQLRDTSATLRALIIASGTDDQAIGFSVTGDSIVLEDGGFVDITYINDSIANYNNRLAATEDSITNYNNRITANEINNTNNQSAITANASGIVDSTNSLLARINADSLLRYVSDTTLDGQLRDTSATLRALIIASGTDDQAIGFSITGDSIVLEDGGFVDITYINDSIANYNSRIGTNETNITSNSTNITNNQAAIIANASGIVDSTNSLLARINADSLLRYVNDTTLDGQLRDTSATLRALIIASGTDDQAIGFSITGDSIVLEDGGFVDITYINDSIANYNNRLAATEDSIANYNSRIGTNETNITSNATNITNNQAAIIANASGIVDSTNSLLARINADSLLRYVNDTTLDGQLRDTSATLRTLITASGTDDQAIGFSITGDSIVLEDGGFVDITYINDSIANYNSRIGTNETNITSNATNITNNQSAITTNTADLRTTRDSVQFLSDSLLSHVGLDNDLSATNELQNLSVNGANDSLLLSSGAGVKLSDITSGISDDQNLSVTSDSIKIENGTGAYIGDIRDSLTDHNTRILNNSGNISTNASGIATNSTAISTETTARQNADGALDTRIENDSTRLNTIATNFSADSTALQSHLSADGDLSATNELQDLSVNGANDSLLLSSGAGVKLSDITSGISDDQNLSITSDSIKIENGTGVYIGDIRDSLGIHNTRLLTNRNNIATNASAISTETTARQNADGALETRIENDSTRLNTIATNFSADSTALQSHLSADGDLSATNELQDLSLNGANDSLLLSSGAGVKLSDITSGISDDQNLSVTSDSIKIENGTGAYIGDIRDSLTDHNTRILNNRGNISTNASGISTNSSAISTETTARQNADGVLDTRIENDSTRLNTIATNFSADSTALQSHLSSDGDLSATNELQDLSLNGANDSLLLSSGAGVKLSDITSGISDDQNLSVTSDSIKIENGTGAYIGDIRDSLTDHNTRILNNRGNISTNASGISTNSSAISTETTARQNADGVLDTRIENDSTRLNTIATNFSVDSTALQSHLSSDGDLSATNELQNLSVNGANDSLLLSSGAGVSLSEINFNTIDTISIIRTADSSAYVSATNSDQIDIAVDDTAFFQFNKRRLEFLNSNAILIGNSTAINYNLNSELIAIGPFALAQNTTGSGNIAIGTGGVLGSNTTGIENTSVGHISSRSLTTGNRNSAFGAGAMDFNTNASENTAIGERAMENGNNGNFNTAIGGRALQNNGGGDQNVALGYHAGANSNGGSNNIFVGFESGLNETGSNKLYIENSNNTSPLIWGDFGTDSIVVNGVLTIDSLKDGSGYTFPGTDGTANQVMVTDGSGNVTWGAVPTTTATCPTGMTAAGPTMCIDTAERGATTWFNAAITCTALGYKLPTWAEWYSGVSIAVGLTDTTNDWEWVDGGTSNTVRKVGNGGTTNSANDTPTNGVDVTFRCITYR